MNRVVQIHPQTPQLRLLKQVATILQNEGVIVYPTDSAYALGCMVGSKKAMERIKKIRDLSALHKFTLVCRNLSELSTYAHVTNIQYRLLKYHIPGPYTFILKGTKDAPKRLMHPKRKTIGIRVPQCKITQNLLSILDKTLISTTLIMPNDDDPLLDPYDIYDILGAQVDAVIDGGYCGIEPTTVISLLDDQPVMLRQGKGAFSLFMS